MLGTAQPLRSVCFTSLRKPSVATPFARITASARPHDSPLRSSRQCFSTSCTRASVAATASPSGAKSAVLGDVLDWNTFFQLRKTRRYFQLGGSIGTSIVAIAAGVQVTAIADMEPFINQIPLDPFITLGLMVFGCGAVGWVTGPIVGTGVFNMWKRKYKDQMAQKEKEFYTRIKKYRVDPSASSMANPVPDYYGEKIGSVAGYRRWLKDQRAFNRKRQNYV